MKKKSIVFSLAAFFGIAALLLTVFAPAFFSYNGVKAVSSGLKNTLSSFSRDVLRVKNGNENKIFEITALNEANTRKYVYAGGELLGIKLYCNGVVVVETDDIETESGKVNPARLCGLRVGDLIKKIDGIEVKTNSAVTEIIEKSGGEEMVFEIERNGGVLNVRFKCVREKGGRYKAGLWIRDSSAGVGTLTFVKDDGTFASLGHAVCDVDTGEALPVGEGVVTQAEITGIIKGADGNAGELCGELSAEPIGEIYKNTESGIYGKLYSVNTKSLKKYPVAQTDEVKKGEAQIISTVENGKTAFINVEITDINRNSPENKNLVLKVTDKELIEKTGGIIQGMSGSPVIQNGMIIGAVTHVFLSDPTSGYGIFIENMLDATD